jgi:pimeloyl-ACP methyl ester carboxylesterase
MLSRLIAGLTLALMIPHAASAQTSRERASLNGFEHRDVALDDGVRIHYLIGGAGPPVVLLHGYPETWYAWRKVMPQLAAQYTVIAPDLRGFGDSSRPAGGYDRKTMAGDIRDLVRRLGYDRVLLAGHDWGGSTAVAYAVAWPAEVRRLVVIEAQPRGPWSEQDPGFREPWFYGFHRIPGFAETIVAGHERQYLTWFYRAFALAPDAIGEGGDRRIHAQLRCVGRDAARLRVGPGASRRRRKQSRCHVAPGRPAGSCRRRRPQPRHAGSGEPRPSCVQCAVCRRRELRSLRPRGAAGENRGTDLAVLRGDPVTGRPTRLYKEEMLTCWCRVARMRPD